MLKKLLIKEIKIKNIVKKIKTIQKKDSLSIVKILIIKNSKTNKCLIYVKILSIKKMKKINKNSINFFKPIISEITSSGQFILFNLSIRVSFIDCIVLFSVNFFSLKFILFSIFLVSYLSTNVLKRGILHLT